MFWGFSQWRWGPRWSEGENLPEMVVFYGGILCVGKIIAALSAGFSNLLGWAYKKSPVWLRQCKVSLLKSVNIGSSEDDGSLGNNNK